MPMRQRTIAPIKIQRHAFTTSPCRPPQLESTHLPLKTQGKEWESSSNTPYMISLQVTIPTVASTVEY